MTNTIFVDECLMLSRFLTFGIFIGTSFLLSGEWRADTKVNDVLYSLVQGSSLFFLCHIRSITVSCCKDATVGKYIAIVFACVYQCACCRYTDTMQIHMIISFVATLRPLRNLGVCSRLSLGFSTLQLGRQDMHGRWMKNG